MYEKIKREEMLIPYVHYGTGKWFGELALQKIDKEK